MDSKLNIDNHKVFPMTYLNRVVFALTFETLDEYCYPDLIQFLKSEFGLEITAERLNYINKMDRPLYFGTPDHTLEWFIEKDKIGFLFKQEAYQSFETSLFPLLGSVHAFLSTINRKCSDILLEKINIIPVTLSSYDELGENAIVVFSENLLKNWSGEYFQKDDDSLLYLTTKEIGDLEIELISGYIARKALEKGQPSRYVLDLTVKHHYTGFIGEWMDKVREINGQLFQTFMESISPEILKSMEEGHDE